ncbi:MAG: thioredoxin [Candidatus Marinimicrobia bacterium]|nr:thioredoxin [Candidatus Neomarinimicrobiota bacterium]
MGEFTREFTEDNFEADVLGASVPVVVDFWAEWCGPCKMLAPTIDKIAKKYNGKVIVGKLNVDNSPSVAQKYNVRSIPNVLIISNGEIKEQVVGNVPEADISALLDKLV